MNHILAIARKELRAYFHSPVALIFLGTFLVVTLFTFFWVDTFFSRNIADVRPLFSWLPILLIFLVGALTMRLWSEEQKLGTLEILMTLPLEPYKLVLGKFLGGFFLVALALGMTFGIPITVSFMGDVDFGPIVGGYFGALLLAGAYLSIGLFVSSLTENQIISLILTVVACSILYALGVDAVTGLAGNRGAELLRSVATGARFESIQRGVIDLRDVLYYASITSLFLILNVLMLRAKKWSDGPRARDARTNAKLFGALAAANLLTLNVLFSGVGAVRLDLTERGEYSVSEVTKTLVRGLDSPLLIRGYFSAKTHPLLAPLVPRIRDFIEEYEVISKGRVRAEFVDPTDDEELEKEANQSFGIKSFPFRIAGRHEAGVVNSYFSILVKYGDQFEVLSFDDLIEVNVVGQDIDVRLRNLEYDLTKTIKKAAYGFQTLEAVFADLEKPVEFTAYITPKALPDNFKEIPERVKTVLKEIEGQSGGKFKWSVVDPDESGDPAKRQELAKKFGFRPFSVSLFSQESFYLHLLLKVGERYQQVLPSESMSEADLRKEIVAAVKRETPGFLKTLGLYKVEAMEIPPNLPPQVRQQLMAQQPQDTSRMLRESLGETYTVETLDLKSGRVPGHIDALMVNAPKDLDEKQQFAIDQYLMRGGTVIVLAGRFELDTAGMAHEGLAVKKINTGLETLLSKYGVNIQESLVLDEQNEPFPIPVVRDLGGIKVRDIKLLRYPFFVDVRRDGMDSDSPIVGGLPAVTMQWASPVKFTAPPAESEAKRTAQVLLHTTKKAWTQSDTEIQPSADGSFKEPSEREPVDLALVVTGIFESAFSDRPSPLFGAEGDAGGDRTGRTVKRSPEGTRLVVVGSANFVNDMVLSVSRQTGGERYTANLQFAENLADWAVSDLDLLTIRSRGSYARTLLPQVSAGAERWELINYAIVAVFLGTVIVFSASRRRRMRPLDLGTRSATPGVGNRPTEVSS